MKRRTYLRIVCCLTGFLFLYTGVSKAIGFNSFVATLSHIRVLAPLATLWACLLTIAEILTGALLLIDRARPAALVTSLILLFSFSFFIAALMITGSHMPCTCGGVISKMSWGQHLVFNLVFIALNAFALKYFMHENRTNRKPV